MSCYEWEHGTIKLSTKEYSRVKKEMIAAVQKYWADNYTNAITLYNKMIAAAKGKRGVEWYKIYRDCKSTKSQPNGWSLGNPDVDLDPDLKFPYCRQGSENKRPLKPKKKDYTPKINRKEFHINFEDAVILFKDKERLVVWHVSENNHAREAARGHRFAQTLFSLLNSVKWTRGTGGQIVGNDEYNQDSYDEGGGGNYLIDEYGPKIKKVNRVPYPV